MSRGIDVETVDLKLDEQNELEFKLEIESSGQVDSPTARLMCEGRGGLSYVFDGKITSDGEVKVMIPSMKGRLAEGEYKTQLEVFVDNKFFVPLEFQANFKKSIKIVAEIKTKTNKPTQMVKAAIVKKAEPVVESKKEDQANKKTLQEQVAKRQRKKELLEELRRKKLEVAKRKRLKELKRKKLEEAKKKLEEPTLDELLADLGVD